VDPAELCSLREARALIGLTYPGLIRAIERGVLTELVDPTKAGTFRCRRWLLRAEVEALAAKRKG
jgi:hypothetical protein